MAATTRKCPKCGGSLTSVNGDETQRICAACGVRFGVRPKAASAAAVRSARPTNAFAQLGSPSEPLPNSPPAAGRHSRLPLVLVGAGLLALLFASAVGALVLAVVLWPRPVDKTTAVAALPMNAPAIPPVADPPSDPAPKPARPDDINLPPVKKPAPPKDKPAPTHDAPPPLQPPAPPPPMPPDLTPPPAPDPMPAPQPAPDVKPPVNPINQAIDKAVVYLKKQALNAAPPAAGAFPAGFGLGRQVGETGLIGLALLESGVPADDPAVAACVNEVRAGEPACSNTYEMAISVWFLDRLGDPKDEDLIHDLGARLVAGQLDHGLWTYNCPTGRGAAMPAGLGQPGVGFPGLGLMGADLTADQLKELMETLEKYNPSKEIPAKKQLAPVCRYVRGKKFETGQAGAAGAMMFGGGDLSLTQFATLGLWVARKHHVPVDRSLLLTESHIRACQAADGGWSYSGMALGMGMGMMGTTDSMTCSGMMELAVARGVGQAGNEKTEKADPQFEKGLQYLAELFDRGVAPGNNKPAANAAQNQNLAAAVGKLWVLQAQVSNPLLQNQAAAWKKTLKSFREELEQALVLDLPADAKKDLQEIDDQIKKYETAPAEDRAKEKKALEQLLQKTAVLQNAGFAGLGLNTGPGRFLKPGKSNRNNLDDIYCLWSVERLCMVCDLKTVAGHDWYAWGANLLVADQNDDGSWPNAGICGQQVDTCLAVLFLKRVNVAKDLTAQLQMIAPIKDLSGEKLKFVTPGETPSPGLTQPSPGERLPATPPPDPLKDAPKP